MIEKAMRECHVSLKPSKNAKQQVPDTIAKVGEHIPIARAQMRIRLSFPVESAKAVRNRLKRALGGGDLRPESMSEEQMVMLVDPGQYRTLDEVVREETKGKGSVEIVDLKEAVEEEEKLGAGAAAAAT